MARPPLPFSPRVTRTLPTLVIISLLQTLAVLPGYAQKDPTITWCDAGAGNYTTNSQFKSNLDRLLANLTTTPITESSGHFYTASTVGPDAAYGLVQCRDHVTSDDCATCLNISASAVVLGCPLRRSAAVRYDYCVLRYSNRSFLGTVENAFKLIAWNTQNASNPETFGGRANALIYEITSRAAAARTKFAVGVTNYSDFPSIYGLAHCTRDLSEGSCDQCLWSLMGNLPVKQIGGWVSAVSCQVGFEISPFFPPSFLVSPPPQPAPSPPPVSSGGTLPPSAVLGGNSTGEGQGKKNSASKIVIITIISVVAAVIFLFAMVVCIKRRPRIRRPMKRVLSVDEQPLGSAESLIFDFGTIRTATGNFSDANKLGEGGFGPVYKGVLSDGQQIAVKRLSRGSGQGLTELRNEVAFIARLQHRNLVRLLGFCLEEEEKMVVYEYLPNTSLDKFLFDPVKRLLLDWGRRFNLIEGIARGLLYLHEDSRLRIIHRDLKASNILLDEHMNPKISDFGLAKLFSVNESHGNTSRIAGTLGYMAPEYAMHGNYSTKSDVFSFGVLVLEIVTGRGVCRFHESGDATDLLSYVWNHWKDRVALQLLDRSVGERYQRHELLRCIHVGLLCVQEDPSDRPNMSSVNLMLSSFSMTLPSPSRPAFFIRGRSTASNYDMGRRVRESSFSNSGTYHIVAQPVVQSANEVSVSDLEPR